MTIRTWIGGGDNSIFEAADWSPAGIPQPGDTLFLESGIANMREGNVNGIQVYLGVQTDYAVLPPIVINLSDKAALTAVLSLASFTGNSAVINTVGMNSLYISEECSYYSDPALLINIAPNSTLKGNFQADTHNAEITIHGATNSAYYQNTGDSSVARGVATIDANVVGIGSFTVSFWSSIQFMGAVGTTQTINLDVESALSIDKPTWFHGLINEPNGGATIMLSGLTNVDSYGLKHDLLSFYAGGQVVDTLHFAAHGSAFQLSKTSVGLEITDPASTTPVGLLLKPLA